MANWLSIPIGHTHNATSSLLGGHGCIPWMAFGYISTFSWSATVTVRVELVVVKVTERFPGNRSFISSGILIAKNLPATRYHSEKCFRPLLANVSFIQGYLASKSALVKLKTKSSEFPYICSSCKTSEMVTAYASAYARHGRTQRP